MAVEISSAERSAYYRAALGLLRFVEQRAPSNRRFGADADALWKGFAGALKASDRIDILLRDADAAWPGAFGARAVFGLRAVAEDDPFGADWASLEPMDGEKMWRGCSKAAAPATTDEALAAIDAVWETESGDIELPKVGATTRLLLGGRSAIASAIVAFAGNESWSWADQVVVVADAPSERQVAAAATAILNITKPTVLRGSEDRDKAGLKGFVAVLSDDVTEDVNAAIEELLV